VKTGVWQGVKRFRQSKQSNEPNNPTNNPTSGKLCFPLARKNVFYVKMKKRLLGTAEITDFRSLYLRRILILQIFPLLTFPKIFVKMGIVTAVGEMQITHKTGL